MLDLAFVRANLPLVEEKLRARGQDPAALLGDFHQLDEERREKITQLETLKMQRNQKSEQIAKLKKSGEDAASIMEEVRSLKDAIETTQAVADQLDERLRGSLARIPNLPHDSVPVGKSEHDNVEIKRWGNPPEFSFQPKPHWEIGEALGILDLERAAKLSGARFAGGARCLEQTRYRSRNQKRRRAFYPRRPIGLHVCRGDGSPAGAA